jgi:hypothetical protein
VLPSPFADVETLTEEAVAEETSMLLAAYRERSFDALDGEPVRLRAFDQACRR